MLVGYSIGRREVYKKTAPAFVVGLVRELAVYGYILKQINESVLLVLINKHKLKGFVSTAIY